MQYTKKFDRLLFLRPDFFKVDLFFFLKTFCYGKRGCIRNFISMQPRFGTLECLRCKVPMMKTTGVYCRKRLGPNINSNVADSFDLLHIAFIYIIDNPLIGFRRQLCRSHGMRQPIRLVRLCT